MNSTLSAQHLCKRYGQKEVVHEVSVSMQQGEIVGLLGPNGAGKTTSFYMITGIIKPTYKAGSLISGTTAGTVTIYEANTSFDPASPVNYVAEGYKAEYKNLTGLWEIRVKYVARVVATEYRTFAEAYAAASTGSTVAGQTIILLDDIDEDDITIETGEDKVRVQFKKWAVSSNVRAEAAEAKEKEKK